MLISHLGKSPSIDVSAFIAPNATICGDVKIGKNTRIMYGAAIIAEGGSIEIGDNCVILENAVLRSTVKHSLKICNEVLIGPNAHVVGCTIENNVFIATGAAIFHGAKLCQNSEVRINGVVHLKTILPENECVPIGWVAIGNPVKILPAEKHDDIWAIQKPLDFPKYVYGVDRKITEESIMPEVMNMMTTTLKTHKDDVILENNI
ncbi:MULTISPECIES: gamma carbonic anhydrase family protein [unclassified Clostridium]|uniref:gamma carbonic anhydrase family protein n=1 Tax=unclassified Clostridium TaxID=2614128 RepID=UPI000297DDB4|nr:MULTISPECIES: gamma carbonic anhydrase family protein [unclassified Clostridium]EKQ52672.1 MAG: isoleucine patch superfamily enzyme, carbonic anhydrase/acetyltransferase [Clostridium sp. Maddingley MBC34-26]